MSRLGVRTAIATVRFALVLGGLLFGVAGTWRFVGGWAYLGLQIGAMTAINLYLLKRDPALLERRLALRETEKVQRVVMGLTRVAGLGLVVVAGLDERFGWSDVPVGGVILGGVLFLIGDGVVFLVFRENTYTASVVKVEEGQTVVSTGPYGWVRHPMYAGSLITGFGTPLLLGSYWAALVLPIPIVLMVVRLLAEERYLRAELAGYGEYMEKTRYRLIPGVW